MSLLTAIVPCYNEEEAIPFFYEEMLKTIAVFGEKYPDVQFEMLFIDDGSKDRTLEVLKELNSKDERVRYVSFSNWTWALIFLALLWILIFARRAGIFTRFFSNRVLIFIGDYSAYLFLIHYEVTKFGKYFLQKAQLQLTLSKALVLIVVELLISLGLSILYKKAENFILGKISANKAK